MFFPIFRIEVKRASQINIEPRKIEHEQEQPGCRKTAGHIGVLSSYLGIGKRLYENKISKPLCNQYANTENDPMKRVMRGCEGNPVNPRECKSWISSIQPSDNRKDENCN